MHAGRSLRRLGSKKALTSFKGSFGVTTQDTFCEIIKA